ncbi:hypothetical protein [Mesorhizobium sp. M1027]|uniref:hypothetical protein n=1 Tax=Mesorhizobium sp. M1027 TaxID=2957050 RepID=UPI00333A74DE
MDYVISESSRDYSRAEVELRIRYGSWPNESADLLFGDIIYPVCGPAFAQEHHDATDKCLPELPLVSNGSNRAGPAGRKFYAAPGVARSNFAIPPGWSGRCRGLALTGANLVEESKLVRITDLDLNAPAGYYLMERQPVVVARGGERVREY